MPVCFVPHGPLIECARGVTFADPEVRRAIEQAIDKQSIVDFLVCGPCVASTQVPGIGKRGHIRRLQPLQL